jgi:hypothetical protein
LGIEYRIGTAACSAEGLEGGSVMKERTDRELLELAAKAAGLLAEPHEWRNGMLWLLRASGSVAWNPLDDDGDAMRLAVCLCIEPKFILIGDCRIDTLLPMYGYRSSASERYAPTHENRLAATRRAIVRAAAEIGAKMPARQQEEKLITDKEQLSYSDKEIIAMMERSFAFRLVTVAKAKDAKLADDVLALCLEVMGDK